MIIYRQLTLCVSSSAAKNFVRVGPVNDVVRFWRRLESEFFVYFLPIENWYEVSSATFWLRHWRIPQFAGGPLDLEALGLSLHSLLLNPDLPNLHHTCLVSACSCSDGKRMHVRFLGAISAIKFYRKKQFDCYITTDREERQKDANKICCTLQTFCDVIVLIFVLLCMTQDTGLQFYKKTTMHFC